MNRVVLFAAVPPSGVYARRVASLAAILRKLEPSRSVEVYTWPTTLREWCLLLKALLGKRTSGVWVVQVPKGLLLIYLVRCLRRRLKVAIDLGDQNVELFRLTFGRVRLGVRVGEWVQERLEASAERVVVRSSTHRSYLAPRVIEKTIEIPDCAHNPITWHDWRERMHTVGVLGTIVWSNSLKWGYGFDLIQILKYLPARYDGLVIGGGPDLAKLKEFAKHHGVADRLTFLGEVSADDLDAATAGAGCYVLSPPRFPPFDVRRTGKLPELLARGHPVISTAVGAAALELPDEWLVKGYPLQQWNEVYREIGERIQALTVRPPSSQTLRQLSVGTFYDAHRTAVAQVGRFL